MCTIIERTNSFAAFCNWIRELSISIKELSNTAKLTAIKSLKKLELKISVTQWESSVIQLERPLIELESSQLN